MAVSCYRARSASWNVVSGFAGLGCIWCFLRHIRHAHRWLRGGLGAGCHRRRPQGGGMTRRAIHGRAIVRTPPSHRDARERQFCRGNNWGRLFLGPARCPITTSRQTAWWRGQADRSCAPTLAQEPLPAQDKVRIALSWRADVQPTARRRHHRLCRNGSRIGRVFCEPGSQ